MSIETLSTARWPSKSLTRFEMRRKASSAMRALVANPRFSTSDPNGVGPSLTEGGVGEGAVLSRSGCLERLRRFQDIRDRADRLVDVRFLDDQRRRQGDDVAGRADQDAALEAGAEDVEGAFAGAARNRLELDAADQADVADVDHVRRFAQRVQRMLERRRHLRAARQQPFVGVGLEG